MGFLSLYRFRGLVVVLFVSVLDLIGSIRSSTLSEMEKEKLTNLKRPPLGRGLIRMDMAIKVRI